MTQPTLQTTIFINSCSSFTPQDHPAGMQNLNEQNSHFWDKNESAGPYTYGSSRATKLKNGKKWQTCMYESFESSFWCSKVGSKLDKEVWSGCQVSFSALGSGYLGNELISHCDSIFDVNKIIDRFRLKVNEPDAEFGVFRCGYLPYAFRGCRVHCWVFRRCDFPRLASCERKFTTTGLRNCEIIEKLMVGVTILITKQYSK